MRGMFCRLPEKDGPGDYQETASPGRNLIEPAMKHIQMVRWNRKRFALSQGELGLLLALTQGEISKLEEDRRSTKLETAFGLQVVFDVQPRDLFVRRYFRVEEAVMRRASRLDRLLRGRKDAASLKKQRLLAAMVQRAKPHRHP